MTSRTTRRLSLTELAADEAVIVAVKGFADYTPAVGMLTVDELLALTNHVDTKQEADMTAQHIAAAARQAVIGAEWTRREAVLRTKAQVVAKYGRDSDEVKAIGLKRQVDRKRPIRRKASTI